ncbi:hypothetical protein E5288_WYG015108 [Bos mutus]|uniref:Lipocalin/cytosolic fatty-acid binding domain-containing protein n=1 Tax=Bos mutus TaxID=72004 RepID=A0A6B0RGP0_9CETA|nr:hypothetical protein [Bos mutus]
MIIRMLSTFRNYIVDFQVGKEFEEDLTGIDDRKCMTTVSWDGDKLECVQKGEKEGHGWTQWIEGNLNISQSFTEKKEAYDFVNKKVKLLLLLHRQKQSTIRSSLCGSSMYEGILLDAQSLA